MKFRLTTAAVALIAASAGFALDSHAQDSYNVEDLYQIRDFEAATLDSRSIETFGSEARFNVYVEYRDPEQRPPNAPATRVIRYSMRCADKTFGVLAIVTLNQRRELMKNHLIPPGGMDVEPVVAGSREEGWMKEVCR